MTAFMAFVAMFAMLQDTAAAQRVSCDVESGVLSRSPAGIAQVSNLAAINLRARTLSPRPMPKGGTLNPLRVETTVYELAVDGARKTVVSSLNPSGAGGDSQSEYATFSIDIPVDPSERDAASRAYLEDVARQAQASSDERERAMVQSLLAIGPGAFAQLFKQHRVGRFQVECRVLDEGRLVGVGRADLEVLFKGRFFDQDGFRKK